MIQHIRRYKRMLLTLSFLGGFGMLILSGCSNPSDSGDKARVEGYATDENGNEGFEKPASGVEGATVTMVRANAQGNFESVTDASATTNASGHFSLEADVEGEENLIVSAQKGSQTWRSHISGTVESGSTVRTAPMTTETSVEAEVYARMVARGEANAWSVSEMKSDVNRQVAMATHGSATAYGDLASAFRNKTEAEAEALSHSSVGLTSSQIDAIASAKAEAQANLESELYAAYGNQSQTTQAYAEAEAEVRQAYESNNADAEARARTHTISGKVLLQSTSSLNSSARGALAQRTSLRTATALDAAVRAQMQALGASSGEIDAVASAGATLQSSIKTASTVGEVKAAFETYHNAVLTELSNSSSINVSGDLVAEIDTSVNSSSGARVTLEAAISAAISLGIDVSAVVDAYVQFYNSVQSIVESTLTSASNADVQAVASIMILVNMST